VLGVLALSAVVATADPDRATFTSPVALVCGWSCCLALVWLAAVALTWRWWLTREDPAGWLATAVVCGAVYLTSCTVRLYVGFAAGGQVAAVEAVDVLMVLVWLLLARRALSREHVFPRIGPIWLGIAMGLTGAVLQTLAITLGNPMPMRERVARLAIAGFGVCGLVSLRQARKLSGPRKRQLMAICAFGALSRVTAPVNPTQLDPWVLVSLVCGLLAAALLCQAGLFLLIQARAQAEAITELAVVAGDGTSGSEQLHEIRASFAGLASAVRLLTVHEGALSSSRRTDLTTMMISEVDRLERLLNGQASESVPDVDLDSVIRALVIARQLAGQQVEWKRTGCHVEGSPDLIATAINMLLVNAAVHAPGSPVRVSAAVDGESVRIRVTDNGPGIPRSVQHHLFARGARRTGSPGRGIGLNFAGRLAAVQGGSLQLAEGNPGSTTFELTLPSARLREVR